ncbi:ribose 5-phosphate isomerase B [Kallipyga massiliensis]|uniref:ribose 5-phosphate isomerase B n=1 Tax=Kallipyga massiliensis TaxID=1472764 RepID=UPI0004B729B3|nr:ribose 5-phosphate isomerase B [Kallipyga massiliensis]
MKIAIASDHAGFILKPAIVDYIRELGHEVKDFGPSDDGRVNYPDYALKVSESVAGGECDLGVLICGTGIGMAITANKVKGIRCGSVSESYSARMSREHNNANVISFGARVVGEDIAKDIVKAFLEGEFKGGRHGDRVKIIRDYESCH